MHSSEATIESDDRPAQRLDRSVTLMEAVGRKSMHHYSVNAPTQSGINTSNNVTPKINHNLGSMFEAEANNDTPMVFENGSKLIKSQADGPGE